VIGLVGPTGGGKSSIVKPDSTLYDASSGRVTIDGCDVREVDIA